jgi:hypothetical protein
MFMVSATGLGVVVVIVGLPKHVHSVLTRNRVRDYNASGTIDKHSLTLEWTVSFGTSF